MMNAKGTLSLCAVLATLSLTAGEYAIRGTTDKDVAIYKAGEKIEMTFRVFDGKTAVAGKELLWTRTGDDGETAVAGTKLQWTRTGDDGKTEKGEGIAGIEGVVVTTSMDKPGFVRYEVKAFGEDGKNLQGFVGGWGGNKTGNIFFDGGACVEPEKLQAVEEPKDFDEFWKAAKAKLSNVPINAEAKEVVCKNPKIKLFAMTLACAGPKPVTGYLTIPTTAGKKSLPAIVQFHGYGIGKHNPPGWFNESAIIFDVNAHGMDLGRNDEYYQQLQKELSGYCFKNNENADREKSYYYEMALRVMRALQYVKTLPEWNGKELQSNGGSQGGLQGLWGAGLDSDVTSCNIWSPWSCDFGGITVGRLRGWRPDYVKALDYFDPVFHAKRIKGKAHLIANYGDYTCAPSGVWIVYNNIPHTNKSLEVKQGCTHGYEMKHCVKYTITPEGIKDTGSKK